MWMPSRCALDVDPDDLLLGDGVTAMGVTAIGGAGVGVLGDGVEVGSVDASFQARRSEFSRQGLAQERGSPF